MGSKERQIEERRGRTRTRSAESWEEKGGAPYRQRPAAEDGGRRDVLQRNKRFAPLSLSPSYVLFSLSPERKDGWTTVAL